VILSLEKVICESCETLLFLKSKTIAATMAHISFGSKTDLRPNAPAVRSTDRPTWNTRLRTMLVSRYSTELFIVGSCEARRLQKKKPKNINQLTVGVRVPVGARFFSFA
jgi:hypothetical protein